MTDWRALCAELAQQLDNALDFTVSSETRLCMKALVADTSTALAAESQGDWWPSEQELYDLADEYSGEPVASMRAALACLGRPAPPSPAVGYGLTDQQIADAFTEGCRDFGKPGEPPFMGGARRVAALLQQQHLEPEPVSADTRYEFSVIDSNYVEQAGGSALTLAQAYDEGTRYLSQYSQDGPHSLELRRVEVLPLPTTTTTETHG